MVENERIFTELLLSIERKYNDVKEMIRSHEKTTVSRAEIMLNRLEEEITLLKKRHTDLETLSHTDDHIHFLQVRLIFAKDKDKVHLLLKCSTMFRLSARRFFHLFFF